MPAETTWRHSPSLTRERAATRVHVLYIGAEADGQLVEQWLSGTATNVLVANELGDISGRHEQPQVDVVLLETSRSGGDHDVDSRLGMAMARFPDSAMVVVADTSIEEEAISAIGAGAQDYVSKADWSSRSLRLILARAMARLEAERRLQQTATELAEANAELCDFAHIIAHDLRAPVRTARILGERMLASMDEQPRSVLELGTRLEGSLRNVDDIIIGMLDYSAFREELPPPVPVPLDEVVSDLLVDLHYRHGVDPSTVLASVDPELKVMGSTQMVSKVLEHVIINAKNFSGQRQDFWIELIAVPRKDRISISVTDNGPGVPAEARERVFQPMERLEPNLPGAGLGLATCRRIIKGLNGSIWIQPSKTPGTTVVIELPSEPGFGG